MINYYSSIRLVTDTPRYAQILPDTPLDTHRYGQIPPDMSRYAQIRPNIPRYPPIPLDKTKYSQIPPNTTRNTPISQDTSKYAQIGANNLQIRPDIPTWVFGHPPSDFWATLVVVKLVQVLLPYHNGTLLYLFEWNLSICCTCQSSLNFQETNYQILFLLPVIPKS